MAAHYFSAKYENFKGYLKAVFLLKIKVLGALSPCI